MKKIKSALARFGPDVLLVCGAGTVAVGCGMIYLPAGLITGGVLAMAGAVVAMFGEEDDR